MYQEMTLDQVAGKARDMKDRSLDFVFSSADMTIEADDSADSDGRILLRHPQTIDIEPNDVAHSQIATRMDIPQRYYQRMMIEAPDLLVDNVNHWMQADPKSLMLRTLDTGDGNLTGRAVLSDRYLRLDNRDVLIGFFEGLQRQGREAVHVLGGTISDKRMSLNLLFRDRPIDVDGDEHFVGVCLRNSEVGFGSCAVYAFLYRSYCTNGMIFGQKDLVGFDRRHIGAKRGHGELSPETHGKILDALVSATGDVARKLSNASQLDALIEPLRKAKRSDKVAHPIPAFEVLGKAVGLSKPERESALERFIREGDYSKFGAANAVTWLANDPDRGAERAQELAEIGGDVINLPRNAWTRVCMAAEAA